MHGVVRLGIAGNRDHEAEGEFGDGGGVRTGVFMTTMPRRVAESASMCVDSLTGAADDAELGGVWFEEGRPVDLDGGADDEGVGVGQFGGEAIFDLVRSDYVPAGFLLEDG